MKQITVNTPNTRKKIIQAHITVFFFLFVVVTFVGFCSHIEVTIRMGAHSKTQSMLKAEFICAIDFVCEQTQEKDQPQFAIVNNNLFR